MDTGKSTPLPQPLPAAHQEISKKHKLPRIFLPPTPDQRRQTQPIHSVAPLKTIEPTEGRSESMDSASYTVDLSVPPPPPPQAYPMEQPLDQPNINPLQNDIEYMQLDENEITLIRHLRQKKIPISEVYELLQIHDDPNNNQSEENQINDSVIQNIIKVSDNNKSLLQAYQLHVEGKGGNNGIQAADSLNIIYNRVKENVLDDIKVYISEQIDEKLQNNRKHSKPSEAPAKKAKTSQIKVVVEAEVTKEHQQLAASWDPTTQRSYYQQQHQPQRMPSNPGQTQIGPNHQENHRHCMKNNLSRQRQQTPQMPGQQCQQGECNSWQPQQPQWAADPRLRHRMARSMQQQSATTPIAPSTHWAHYYGQGGQY